MGSLEEPVWFCGDLATTVLMMTGILSEPWLLVLIGGGGGTYFTSGFADF
jgi:hypothetical protein